MTEIAFEFTGTDGERARDVAAFVEALPRLCRGWLEECDLSADSGTWRVVARFRGLSEAVRSRLAFWSSRLGGSMGEPAGGAPADPGAHRRVSPRLLGGAVRRLLPPGADPPAPGGPCLELPLGTPQAAGLSFDVRRGGLFVPGSRSPPVGDEVRLRLRLPDGAALEVDGVVAAVRAEGEDGPGAPAGFILALAAPGDAALRALEEHAGPRSGARRHPRYPVRARAALLVGGQGRGWTRAVARLAWADEDDLAADYAENLSQGGAFVRTQADLPPGTRIRVDLELPGGRTLVAPGVVVHRNDRGVGVRFELDPALETELAEVVAGIAARKRRALVVDDDLLARRMLGDALAARGFEVLAAEDGTDGLRILAEELLGLDLLVADLHMPIVDGERLLGLVRRAGGERDLGILIVTADPDPTLERRLLAAGADAVVGKGPEMAAAGAAAEAIVQRRRRAQASAVARSA
jgi:CheY-like chemotaxis protein/Tfp pilus assembly protein PilZ